MFSSIVKENTITLYKIKFAIVRIKILYDSTRETFWNVLQQLELEL